MSRRVILDLRRRGVAVVHHAGVNGRQRGTSRREDTLDTVIALRRPSDYLATQGARFEVHFEKGRGLFWPEAKPFEANLNHS
jgi:putative DNA primase/helicase